MKLPSQLSNYNPELEEVRLERSPFIDNGDEEDISQFHPIVICLFGIVGCLIAEFSSSLIYTSLESIYCPFNSPCDLDISHIKLVFGEVIAFFTPFLCSRLENYDLTSFFRFKLNQGTKHDLFIYLFAFTFMSLGLIPSKQCKYYNVFSWECFSAIIIECLIPAIMEELYFRAWLFGLLEEKVNKYLAMALTSSIFTFVHFQTNFVVIVLLFCMSYMWNYCNIQMKSHLPSIFAHLIYNFVISVLPHATNIFCRRAIIPISFMFWAIGITTLATKWYSNIMEDFCSPETIEEVFSSESESMEDDDEEEPYEDAKNL